MPTFSAPAPGSAAAAAASLVNVNGPTQSSTLLARLAEWKKTQQSSNQAENTLICLIEEFMRTEHKFIEELNKLVSFIQALHLGG